MYRVKMTQALDFVKVTSRQIDYWHGKDVGDWEKGCAIGRRRASALIDFMSSQGDPSVLGRVGKAITTSGRHGSVEVGFFNELAVNLIQ